MEYFLTSSPSVSMDGAINPANGFLDNLRRALSHHIRCIFVTTYPDDIAFSEHCSNCMRKAFEEVGFQFEWYELLDRRTAPYVEEMVHDSNFIIFGGGHVPSQNAFLHELGMPRLIKEFDGVVLGISAGSMNCARVVYAQPEEPGEALDKNYVRYLPGLGLTEVQILPHYYLCKDMLVDGLKVYDDIAMPDSKHQLRRFYVFPDGTYLYGMYGMETIYGEFFLIENGVLRKVADNGQQMQLPFI
ncbi:MAG: Type 1 glutamine amidotransferase-like domain-containing protein [Parabacteroides sp.]